MTRFLTDADRNRAWRQARIQTFESAEPSAAPVLLSIGAQPGAGKTRAVARTMNTFYPARSFVPIIGDNLRRYHPDYPALVSSPDPDLMPAATAELAGWLVRRSLEHAARHRYCAIVEGTLRSPETTLGTIRQFTAAGATTHLVILGVPEVDSWTGCIDRYLTPWSRATPPGGRPWPRTTRDTGGPRGRWRRRGTAPNCTG